MYAARDAPASPCCDLAYMAVKCNHSAANGMLFSFHCHLITWFDKIQLDYSHSLRMAALSKEKNNNSHNKPKPQHFHFPGYKSRYDLETAFEILMRQQKFYLHKEIF